MIEIYLKNGKTVQAESFTERENGLAIIENNWVIVYPWGSINFYRADSFFVEKGE